MSATLPTVAQLASYLRLDDDQITSQTAELTLLLSAAVSIFEGYVTVPIQSVERVYVDNSQSGVQFANPTVLFVPNRPISEDADKILVQDRDGQTVDATTFKVFGQKSEIRANWDSAFPFGPYTITYNTGLELLENYSRVEPMVNQAIIDLASDLYQRRNPGAHVETAGDSHVTWDVSHEVLVRVMMPIKLLKLPVVAI